MATGVSIGTSPAILHPDCVTSTRRIRELLVGARDGRIDLDCGLSRKITRRTAQVKSLSGSMFVLSGENLEASPGEILRVTFNLRSLPYWFEAKVIEIANGQIHVHMPSEVFRGERRSRERQPPAEGGNLAIRMADRVVIDAVVEDWSPEGMSVHLPASATRDLDRGLLELKRGSLTEYGAVRYQKPSASRPGWTQIGLEVWPLRPTPVAPTDIEDLSENGASLGRRAMDAVALAGSVVGAGLSRITQQVITPASAPVEIVDFTDRHGRPMRGIMDRWGPQRDSIAVVIPPAWGRTKETLLPLAHTIVECFRRAGQPVTVLRYDGVGKRGESHREPAAMLPGMECARLQFSQGVNDIEAAIDFLWSGASPPRKTLLVSFSAASIEARRATARDSRIDGWVCVVGSADLQSMMKRVSGGVDYALGIERGVSFGLQEILGVLVDMDYAGRDALDHNLVYLGDSRRDMAEISVPITWIHGRADAWMDLGRIQDAMSQGDSSARRLVGVPMGHMLRSSREALSVFEFIASELSRISGGPRVPSGSPALSRLARKRRAEQGRLRANPVDLKQFWEEYLLGGGNGVGYELLTAIRPFRSFMDAQIGQLNLQPGDRVLDLGSGTGSFLRALGPELADGCTVVGIDLIHGAIARARGALKQKSGVHFAQADVGGGFGFPLASGVFDRVLASLFISYAVDPDEVLREIGRVLRPGGRLVLSGLRRDADMSKLFIEGAQELRATGLPGASEDDIEGAVRRFANQAARLLDHEEQGTFSFWDGDETASWLRKSGWSVESVTPGFGEPPQAVILSAIRRA